MSCYRRLAGPRPGPRQGQEERVGSAQEMPAYVKDTFRVPGRVPGPPAANLEGGGGTLYGNKALIGLCMSS